jgi:hypothetical protein
VRTPLKMQSSIVARVSSSVIGAKRLAAVLISCGMLTTALAQTPVDSSKTTTPSGLTSSDRNKTSPPAGSAKPAPTKKATAGKTDSGKTNSNVAITKHQPDRFAGRAGTYYRMVWGVDSLAVKWAESGEIIRFSYRVLDVDKARVLNDKKSEPSLIDPKAGVKLVVPSLEQVGQLRQSTDPEEGKSYWMAFSNKGRPVKRGDHVSVVIGTFKADGLVVD